MEKRSRRRIRDLVTQAASQGLSENEIGCARISMMAKSMNALFTGRIQKRKTNPLHRSHLTCRCSPLVPIKNKIKLTGAEHEKLLCWHWFVVRGRGRRIQEEIKITLTLRLVVVAGERRDV